MICTAVALGITSDSASELSRVKAGRHTSTSCIKMRLYSSNRRAQGCTTCEGARVVLLPIAVPPSQAVLIASTAHLRTRSPFIPTNSPLVHPGNAR